MFGKGKLPFDFTDCIFLIGVSLAFYGIYGFDSRIAYIVLGSGLIYWAIQIERGRPNGKPS